MRTQPYPSDLTDGQWALVKPLIPVYPGGRPRKTSMRDVLDAIFYVLRTGCQWRFLPTNFPPKSTVWGYFNEWRHNGTLERIHQRLRDRVRQQEKPGRPRRTAKSPCANRQLIVRPQFAGICDCASANSNVHPPSMWSLNAVDDCV